MTSVSLSVRCTREEYIRYRTVRMKKPWLVTLLGVLAIASSGVLSTADTQKTLTAAILPLVMIGLLLFIPFALYFYEKGAAAKQYDESTYLREAFTLVMDEQTLRVRTACHEGTLPLTLLTAVEETGDAIGLVFGKELSLCVPKRALSEKESNAMKQLLHTAKKRDNG